MNKKDFSNLLVGIDQMKRHLRGDRVPGTRTSRMQSVDARKIRRASGLSQSEFARLIDV